MLPTALSVFFLTAESFDMTGETCSKQVNGTLWHFHEGPDENHETFHHPFECKAQMVSSDRQAFKSVVT
jgi:hypothetical protein